MVILSGILNGDGMLESHLRKTRMKFWTSMEIKRMMLVLIILLDILFVLIIYWILLVFGKKMRPKKLRLMELNQDTLNTKIFITKKEMLQISI